jgi:translation initiation factor IF-2
MAEMIEIKADPNDDAQGIVIESRMETGKGPVATVLIKTGTLHVSDWIQIGESFGRVKSMEDEHGKRLKAAEPSRAVRISGLKGVPQVSELLQAFGSEKEAIDEANKAKKYSNVKKVANVKKLGIEAITEQVAARNKSELGIVVKADVVGSLDAIKESLNKCCNKEVGIKFVGEGVGPISESDIQMAAVSDKIVIGFKIGIAPGVDGLAKTKGVKIVHYDVIYELIDDIKKILAEMMPMIRTEIPVGVLKVLGVFKSSPGKTVVGGKVEDGRAEKEVDVHVKRNGEVIHDYKVEAIQREKDEVASVPAGTECGLSFNTKADIQVGDVLEFFRVEEHRKGLDD